MAKIQIRRGVFETNSSSVHTLSIMKELPEGFKFPKELVFGKGPDVVSDYVKQYYKPGDEDYKENIYSNPTQERADILFYHITGFGLLSYIKLKEAITEQLEQVGVKAIFRDGAEDYGHLKRYDLCKDEEGYYDCEEYEDMYLDLIKGELYRTEWKEKEDGTIEPITYKLKSKTPFIVNFLFGPDSFATTWEDDTSDGPEIKESCYEFSKRDG